MSDTIDGTLVERFVRLLRSSPTVRVSRERIWHAMAQVFPHRPSGPAERDILLALLKAAEERGAITMPSPRGSRWDRSMLPAIPINVDIVRAVGTAASDGWRAFPWHPRLQWAADCRTLTPAQVAFLRRVHEGLVQGAFEEPAPLKYRSLQLTGHEKRLGQLATTGLFGEGRISLELLGCLPEVLPLAWESVGSGRRMVIFENAGPFAVARRVFAAMDPRPFDLVAWGAGRGILAAVGHIQSIVPRPESIAYVGDLDWPGLDILAAVREQVRHLGLPAIVPATELHQAMLTTAAHFGHPQGWPVDASHRPPRQGRQRLIEALDDSVREQVDVVLRGKNRIPEEVLGPEEMRAAYGGTRAGAM